MTKVRTFKTFFMMVFAALTIVLTLRPAVYAMTCHQSFAAKVNETQRLISYFEQLYKADIISKQDAEQFFKSINDSKIENPIRKPQSSVQLVHFEAMQKILDDGFIDLGEIIVWIEEFKAKEDSFRVEKQAAEDQTKNNTLKIKFVRIDVTHIGSFEIMSTVLTQYQWAKLVGNIEFLKVREDLTGTKPEDVTIGRQVFQIQPNHPAILKYPLEASAQILEKLNGLSKTDNPLIFEVIPDHKKGSKYRLPTGEEWQVMARTAGRGWAKMSPEYLEGIAWTQENSGGVVHPVAELKPTLFGGQPIYDIFGNVYQMVDDKIYHVSLYGGSYIQNARSIFLVSVPFYGTEEFSIRLVRELQP